MKFMGKQFSVRKTIDKKWCNSAIIEAEKHLKRYGVIFTNANKEVIPLSETTDGMIKIYKSYCDRHKKLKAGCYVAVVRNSDRDTLHSLIGNCGKVIKVMENTSIIEFTKRQKSKNGIHGTLEVVSKDLYIM